MTVKDRMKPEGGEETDRCWSRKIIGQSFKSEERTVLTPLEVNITPKSADRCESHSICCLATSSFWTESVAQSHTTFRCWAGDSVPQQIPVTSQTNEGSHLATGVLQEYTVNSSSERSRFYRQRGFINQSIWDLEGRNEKAKTMYFIICEKLQPGFGALRSTELLIDCQNIAWHQGHFTKVGFVTLWK